MIRSTTGEQTYVRQRWSSANGQVQGWVNELMWKALERPAAKPTLLPLSGLPAETAEVCRQALFHNGLEGIARLVFGEQLEKALGAGFVSMLDGARARTELFLQEVHWLLGPKLGAQVILVGDHPMRAFYESASGNDPNPRMIHSLQLWTPTLATREEVISVLCEGGYVADRAASAGYVYQKTTEGIPRQISLHGTLWESSKNWSLDLEREIWDRALQYSSSFPMKPETSDFFIMICRRFSIDSLGGSAICLLDLVLLLEREGDNIDWDRVRSVKNRFQKPDWLWLALLGIDLLEKKTGRKLELPAWAREGIKDALDTHSFLVDFVLTRFNWACPDARIIDFPRAFMKVAKGT